MEWPKILGGIRVTIMVPHSNGFQIYSILLKVHFLPEKRCKPHLHRPKNTDAISCGAMTVTQCHCHTNAPRQNSKYQKMGAKFVITTSAIYKQTEIKILPHCFTSCIVDGTRIVVVVE